jgi:hypothetical protein
MKSRPDRDARRSWCLANQIKVLPFCTLRSMAVRYPAVLCGCLGCLLAMVAGTAWPAGAVAGEWLFGFGAGVPYSYGAQHGLAMNGSGEAALIFGFNGVRVSLRPSDGYFEDPEWGGVRVSAEGVEGSTPAVAIDDRGDVVAVWQQYTGPHKQIYEATRQAGGSFGAPQPVSPGAKEASAPSVAINARGEATVTWLSNDGTNDVVEAATATLGGTFSSPAGLSGNGGNASDPQVVTNSAGESIVSWERNSTEGLQLEAAVCQAGMSFPPPDAYGDGDMLGETAAVGAPHVVLDEAGEGLAVWKSPSGAVRSARLPAHASSFGPTVTLASATGLPSAAMNGSGQAVAGWPSGHGVQVVSAAPGASFGAAVELPSYFAPAAAQVTIGATGDTAVEWEGMSEGGSFGREGSYRPPTGAFAKPTGLYGGCVPEEGSLVVASDSVGDMVGVWDTSCLNDMESMLYDAGPQLGAISAPTNGVVGQSVAFSIASPPSIWTPLQLVTWNFGDGATANGLAVSHAYASPGTYQVTVTATDTQHTGLNPAFFPEYVGNSQSQMVVVSPASAASSVDSSAASNNATESLSALRISPSSFVAASAGPAAIATSHRGNHRTGATVRFKLNLPGRVIFIIDHAVAGTRNAGKCLAQAPSTRRHGRRCVFLRSLGHLTRSSREGASSFHFTGRIDNRKLTPGRYVLVATAEGAHQTVAQQVAFRVLSD